MQPISPIFPSIPEAEELVFAKNQPQYKQFPAFRYPNGLVVTRWKFSLIERIKFLFSGNLWLSIQTFNNPLQPVKLQLDEPLDK